MVLGNVECFVVVVEVVLGGRVLIVDVTFVMTFV